MSSSPTNKVKQIKKPTTTHPFDKLLPILSNNTSGKLDLPKTNHMCNFFDFSNESFSHDLMVIYGEHDKQLVQCHITNIEKRKKYISQYSNKKEIGNSLLP